MADAELLTRITLQNQEFQNEIRRCKSEINDLKNSAISSSSGISSMVGSFAKFAGISLGVGAVVGGIKDLATSSIDAYRNIEMLKTSFTTLLGSASQADQLVNSLRQYGTDSPYDTEGLARAAQLMLGYGMNLQQIMPTLRQLGDIAMGDNNKLQSLALAFSQMSAAGKVCKQDLNQMVNAGFNPLQIISEQTGESIGTLTDKVSKGQISVHQIEQAFKDATSEGGKFHNMASNMSSTLDGQLASLNDEWTTMKQTMGEIIAPVVKEGLVHLTGVVSDLSSALMAVKKAIDDINATKHSGGLSTDQKTKYQNQTDKAIEWAYTKGSGEKSIKRAIKQEEKKQKADRTWLKFYSNKANRLNNKNKKGLLSNKKGRNGKTEYTELIEAEAQQRTYADRIMAREERLETYKGKLTPAPNKPQPYSPTKYTPSKGGGRKTPSKEEVIPEGSLKALEKKLQEAQNAASLAVGEQAYQTAMATVKKIEDAIANFKWGGAGPNTAKNVSKIGTLDKTGGLVTNSTPNLKLPSMNELKPIGDIIEQDQIDKINKLAEALENAKGVFESYGGDTVGLQNQILDLAKAYKTTGDATSLAGAGMALVGQQMQALGENGAAAKAGAMIAAIGQIVLGFASASKLAGETEGPWGWIAWLGAGLAALATTISTVQSFSQGGIINGGSVAGDQMLARVNAGEMILNGSQQQKLFNTLDSNGAIGGGFNGGEVDFKISGSVLKGVLRNYDNKTSIL